MALPVRRFKDVDFTNAVKLMGDGGTKRFIALRLLLTAITSKQREDIQKARDMLCAALAFHRREIDNYEHSFPRWKKDKRMSIYPIGSPMDELHRHFHPDLSDEVERLTKRYLTEDPVRLLAMEMSAALRPPGEGTALSLGTTSPNGPGVQLILWHSGTRLIPALYCHDLETAAYATALFGRAWRVCPYSACWKWFVPRRATQEFCCPAHREAHRVARWRERHKVRSKRH
jgi:hypothetical protein